MTRNPAGSNFLALSEQRVSKQVGKVKTNVVMALSKHIEHFMWSETQVVVL